MQTDGAKKAKNAGEQSKTDRSCHLYANGLRPRRVTPAYESVGRTDFPGGSAAQLRQSVQALLALEGDKTVYPGHDEPTTLSHERKFNPFA